MAVKTYRIIPLVFILFLFGLTLIPAPIVIAQQADDVVVECRPVTKTEEREVCKEQPKTEWDEQRQKKITMMETVCTKKPYTVIVMETVCTKQPYTVIVVETVCTKELRNVTYQECAK
jgi:hypothetical protein